MQEDEVRAVAAILKEAEALLRKTSQAFFPRDLAVIQDEARELADRIAALYAPTTKSYHVRASYTDGTTAVRVLNDNALSAMSACGQVSRSHEPHVVLAEACYGEPDPSVPPDHILCRFRDGMPSPVDDKEHNYPIKAPIKELMDKPPRCPSNQHSAGWYAGLQCTRCGDVD